MSVVGAWSLTESNAGVVDDDAAEETEEQTSRWRHLKPRLKKKSRSKMTRATKNPKMKTQTTNAQKMSQ